MLPWISNLSIPTTQKIQFPHPINVLHTHPTPPSGLNPALLDPYPILINWQILVGGLQPKISQFLVVFFGKFGKIVCWPPWRGLFIGGSRGQDQFHVVTSYPRNHKSGWYASYWNVFLFGKCGTIVCWRPLLRGILVPPLLLPFSCPIHIKSPHQYNHTPTRTLTL